MREDAADLAVEHADVLRARGHLNAAELLDGQGKGVLLIHRRDVVEAIEIGDGLRVRLVLDQLFGTTMQQADMRIDTLDHLAVEFKHQAQHAVRRRVLGPEVEVHVPGVWLGNGAHVLDAFSSPGRTYFAPSHGDMKSNLRKSCTRRTGS